MNDVRQQYRKLGGMKETLHARVDQPKPLCRLRYRGHDTLG